MPNQKPYTDIEKEIIVLRAVWDLIDGMVNYVIFCKGHGTLDAELKFNSAETQRLFNILLADFLSRPGRGEFDLSSPAGPKKTDYTFLFDLLRICNDSKLNSLSTSILIPVQEFIDWLEGECVIERVWFPSIEIETDVHLKRITYLKICGDIAKHSFSRLGRNVNRIMSVLNANGVEIDEGQGFLILPDFYDWFHKHVLNYHGSTIAEFLNNIRWGIFEYLQPEFTRSFEKTGELGYRFKQPEDCIQPLALAMHWDLMNQVRGEPYFPRFQTTSVLKRRY
jgi:hypothetical protein